MTGETPGRAEPEPIEAEFEPADGAAGQSPRARQTISWRAPVDRRETLAWAAASALVGALVAIAASNIGSGGLTGGLRTEVTRLSRDQAELSKRAGSVVEDVVALRARTDAQAERLTRGDENIASARTELAAIRSQMAALFGASSDSASTGATLASNPFGRLLSRLEQLEAAYEEDAESPRTTRQMQRAVRDLSDQVEALDEASTSFTVTLNRRQASLEAIEKGLEQLSADVDALERRLAEAEKLGPALGEVRRNVTDLSASAESSRAPVLAAAAESRALRALSALATAAEKGKPFVSQYETLAKVLPADPAVAALREPARRGAPSLAQLRQEFAGAVAAAQRAAAAQTDDGWDWLRGAMSGIVSVRRTDADQNTSRLLKQATDAMDGGDVRRAIQAIDALSPAPAAAFRVWRERAVRRADLDDRVEALNARLVSGGAVAKSGE